MLTYKEAAEMIATARNPTNGVALGNNTRLFERQEALGKVPYYAVQLHQTDVVRIFKDGTYQLNNGGYFSVTSKDRINLYGPVRVYSHKGTWYVGAVVYTNGMLINSKLLGDK